MVLPAASAPLEVRLKENVAATLDLAATRSPAAMANVSRVTAVELLHSLLSQNQVEVEALHCPSLEDDPIPVLHIARAGHQPPLLVAVQSEHAE